ncbi:unnamed protein product [Urochloa humidicola]
MKNHHTLRGINIIKEAKSTHHIPEEWTSTCKERECFTFTWWASSSTCSRPAASTLRRPLVAPRPTGRPQRKPRQIPTRTSEAAACAWSSRSTCRCYAGGLEREDLCRSAAARRPPRDCQRRLPTDRARSSTAPASSAARR